MRRHAISLSSHLDSLRLSVTFIPLKEKNNCNRDESAKGNTMAAPANATSVVDAQYVSTAVVSYLQEREEKRRLMSSCSVSISYPIYQPSN